MMIMEEEQIIPPLSSYHQLIFDLVLVCGEIFDYEKDKLRSQLQTESIFLASMNAKDFCDKKGKHLIWHLFPKIKKFLENCPDIEKGTITVEEILAEKRFWEDNLSYVFERKGEEKCIE
ncbi:MAG: hypothetical protein ACTSUP_07905 [Candidatus Heimdallarchaeaceae archaeon]